MRRTPLAELLQNELERQDFHPRLPGYKRVYEAIRSAIVNRRLPAGSKLPSSRDLARELSASRNMIVAAKAAAALTSPMYCPIVCPTATPAKHPQQTIHPNKMPTSRYHNAARA